MADTPKESSAPEPTAEDLVAVADEKKNHMAVRVYAPFRVYFEGNATSVSAENETGPFDILPMHRNFLCMLVPCTLTVQPVEGPVKKIKIHRALMHVKADKVVVFMDV